MTKAEQSRKRLNATKLEKRACLLQEKRREVVKRELRAECRVSAVWEVHERVKRMRAETMTIAGESLNRGGLAI